MRTFIKTCKNNRIVVIAFTVVMILAGVIVANSTVSKADTIDNNKYFVSIQIEAGDTLTSIADEYMSDEYGSRDSLIQEIKTINNIHEDYITAGCYIVVPYYSDEPVEL